MKQDFSGRIVFDESRETMEIDLSGVTFENSADVNLFYDFAEASIAGTGQDKWFFLINYGDCRIFPKAWLAHSLRGKKLNEAHSLGTVRYDASDETRAEIAKRAETDSFDANLFADRDAAVARIEELRAARPAKRVPAPSQYPEAEFARRIRFLDDIQVMDVDFSDFDFDTNSDVRAFYDHIEARIAATGRKWYFIVDYRNCRIDLRVWIAFSQRGKRLNLASSLGSVRYHTAPETEAEIRRQAATQDFRPNIRRNREEALARVEEMKAEAKRDRVE